MVAGIRGFARCGGRGRPVVLVHGLAVSSLYFVPLARRLELSHTVLAPDLPGYGRSATPSEPLDVAGLCAALLEWLDLAELACPWVIANSLGCQVAVELAVSAPERVAGLVLVGPTMDPSAPSPAEQFRRLVRDIVREPWRLNVAQSRDYLRMGPRRILTTARYALEDPLQSKLPDVRQPSLVIRGGRDAIVSQAWAEHVAAALPRGSLLVIEGAAHAAHWSAADEVARVVEEFE
jgi:pimeloyl-ACP methyl ester carboxylesterase